MIFTISFVFERFAEIYFLDAFLKIKFRNLLATVIAIVTRSYSSLDEEELNAFLAVSCTCNMSLFNVSLWIIWFLFSCTLASFT